MAATTSNVYFACLDCKVYVDAGYRWAVWHLEESGIVGRGAPVSIERLRSARDYWTPPKSESSYWLEAEVLPSARRFLDEHRCHRLVFGGPAVSPPPNPATFSTGCRAGSFPVFFPASSSNGLVLKPGTRSLVSL